MPLLGRLAEPSYRFSKVFSNTAPISIAMA